jgi:hypothetical protein
MVSTAPAQECLVVSAIAFEDGYSGYQSLGSYLRAIGAAGEVVWERDFSDSGISAAWFNAQSQTVYALTPGGEIWWFDCQGRRYPDAPLDLVEAGVHPGGLSTGRFDLEPGMLSLFSASGIRVEHILEVQRYDLPFDSWDPAADPALAPAGTVWSKRLDGKQAPLEMDQLRAIEAGESGDCLVYTAVYNPDCMDLRFCSAWVL